VAAASVVTASAAAAPVPPQQFARSFVERSGAALTVARRPFRFGGANVEWLGVAGYGPADPTGPHYPTNFEIDDALATAREMGARVVRSQTMGDSVGCALCLEPAPGRFNPRAFERIDYALRSARRHGLKIVPTIVGDDAHAGGSGCVYLRWRGIDVPGCSLVNMAPFWSDAAVRGDVERHVAALLNHRNVYTGIAYKDDPTILGWDLLNGGDSPRPWTRAIVDFIRTIDKRHLVLSSAWNATIPGVDVCVAFVYPHWSQPWSSLADELVACRSARRPFFAYEYGWDRTNYATIRAFRRFLRTLQRNRLVVGDAFWALQAHRRGHGWMPIPANTTDPEAARRAETGQWWALYYTGIRTLVHSAREMAARGQVIRAHNYAMAGSRVPPPAPPPAPTITASTRTAAGVRIYWQGSAGAATYSVERARTARGPWRTVCHRCATDAGDGYLDRRAGAVAAWYRVVPYNVSGRAGRASRAYRAA
jgi:hypothetical protein